MCACVDGKQDKWREDTETLTCCGNDGRETRQEDSEKMYPRHRAA